jgi:hypothetical protein
MSGARGELSPRRYGHASSITWGNGSGFACWPSATLKHRAGNETRAIPIPQAAAVRAS